jgi:nucleotide-binding universal stress UspA family protein
VEAEPHVTRVPEVTITKILIATDFSPSSESALRYAAGMARRFESKVYLFTVVEPTLFNVAGPGALSLAIDATLRDMRRLESELVVEGCFAGLQIELVVRSGDVCEQMSEMVTNQHIDLIATGTHGRTGASRPLLGSVAQHVFQQSRVPVLLVGPNVDANLWAEGLKRVLFPTDFTPASRYAFPAPYRWPGDLKRNWRPCTFWRHLPVRPWPTPTVYARAFNNRCEKCSPVQRTFLTKRQSCSVLLPRRY